MKFNFLTGVFKVEALYEPMQSCAFAKSALTAKQVAELVSVQYKATDLLPCLRDSRASRAAATASGGVWKAKNSSSN